MSKHIPHHNQRISHICIYGTLNTPCQTCTPSPPVPELHLLYPRQLLLSHQQQELFLHHIMHFIELSDHAFCVCYYIIHLVVLLMYTLYFYHRICFVLLPPQMSCIFVTSYTLCCCHIMHFVFLLHHALLVL